MIWKDGRKREERPIDARLPELLELLKNNQVVIAEAETSAGKTSRIPQAILTEWPDVMVNITQPRRMLVRANARWVAYEMGSRPGDKVGWKLFGEEPVISKNTRCVFRVDQGLANQIRRTGKLPEGIIIVDEAHERTVAIDTLLIMLGEMLPKFPKTKLIITSATIDTKKFSEYFGNAPIMSIKGRCFPVETFVRPLAKHEHHSEGAISAAKEIIKKFLDGQLAIQDKDCLEQRITVDRGTVLVFLPGKEDIEKAISSLKSFVDSLKEQKISVEAITLETKEIVKAEKIIELFACHSEISAREQDRSQDDDVFERTLRMVCTTDIARSSLTFPRMVGVIDSLQVKRPFVDQNGVSHLDKIPVSRAEADQAKGRAGRTQCGFYIPIGEEYGSLQMYPTPAILREPLPSVVLQLISAGINPRSCKYIDAPDSGKISVAIERLKKIGALNAEEKITEIGEIIIQFPLEPEQARVLITADRLGVLSEAVIATSCINNEGIYFTPKKDAENVVVEQRIVELILKKIGDDDYSLENLPFWIKKGGEHYTIDTGVHSRVEGARGVADIVRASWTESKSDFVAMVEAYRAFKAQEFQLREEAKDPGQKFRRAGDELFDWCRRNFLNFKKLRLVENTIHQIKEVLKSSPLQLQNGIVNVRQFDADALSKAIASGLVDNIGKRSDGRYGNYSSRAGDFQKNHSSVCPDSDLILNGGLRKVEFSGRRGRTSHFLLADLAAMLKIEWLEEIMPQFCSQQKGVNPYYDADKDSVMSTTIVNYSGQEIGQRKEADPQNSEAEKLFLKAFVNKEVSVAKEIVEANAKVRDESDRLWTRSGGVFQQITHDQEKALYEREILGKGINSASAFLQAVQEGKINPKNLYLPQIPEEDRKKVETENPETLVVDGETLTIIYKRDWSENIAKVEVSEEFVRKASAKAVILPSRRSVKIFCRGYSADSFTELVEKLEKVRIEQCWGEARSKIEGDWTSSAEKAISLLAGIGKEVEVAKSDNGSGKPIIGFVGLKIESGNYWKLFLAESKEKAQEKTAEAIKRLVDKVSGEMLVVPREEMWCDRWGDLNDLGKILQIRFTVLVKEQMENLTAENFSERVETIKTEAEKIKAEISNKASEVKKLIADTEEIVEKRISAIENISFVEAEAEQARAALREAKEKNKFLAGDEIKAACEKASVIAGQLAELFKLRTAGVLFRFEAGYRDGGVIGRCNGWVIDQNGICLDPSGDDRGRHQSDYNKYWTNVGPRCLVLRWRCGTVRNVDGTSTFEVVKVPVGGCTQEQLATVAQIEADIGASIGKFGLGGKIKEARKEENKENNEEKIGAADMVARMNAMFK